MSKRQIFGSIFDVGRLIGFQKNPMIGREEGFGITDKLLSFYRKIFVLKSIYISSGIYMIIHRNIWLNVLRYIICCSTYCSIYRLRNVQISFHVILDNGDLLNIDYWYQILSTVGKLGQSRIHWQIIWSISSQLQLWHSQTKLSEQELATMLLLWAYGNFICKENCPKRNTWWKWDRSQFSNIRIFNGN